MRSTSAGKVHSERQLKKDRRPLRRAALDDFGTLDMTETNTFAKREIQTMAVTA
jgi:hypothetical protein